MKNSSQTFTNQFPLNKLSSSLRTVVYDNTDGGICIRRNGWLLKLHNSWKIRKSVPTQVKLTTYCRSILKKIEDLYSVSLVLILLFSSSGTSGTIYDFESDVEGIARKFTYNKKSYEQKEFSMVQTNWEVSLASPTRMKKHRI